MSHRKQKERIGGTEFGTVFIGLFLRLVTVEYEKTL